MRLPPPQPPANFAVLLRRSSTWIPEAVGIPRNVVREARKLAGEVASGVGRRDAIARYIVAVAASRTGTVSLVARIPLFRTPGLLIAHPAREAFYWTVDPMVPPSFEERAAEIIAATLKSLTSTATRTSADTDVTLPGRTAS